MKKLKAVIAKVWRAVFNLESAVERFVRASLGVLGVSGLAFAHQVAAEVGMPRLVRAIQLSSLGAMFLSWVIAAAKPTTQPPKPAEPSAPPAPPAAGFVRLRVLVLLLVAACAGAAALIVSPASAAVRPGETVQFLVEGATSAVTWSITEGAAGGTISATGLYTAPCPAVASTFHVTAAAGGVTSSPATVSVAPDHVVAVVVTPGTVSLQPLATQQFTATVTSACGAVSTDTVLGAALLRKAVR